VLRDGNVVEDGMISQFTPQELVKAIVGRENERFQLKDFKHGEVVLAVNKLCGPRVYPTTFELRRGEILGLVGLNGAGQREVGRFVAGALPKFSGEVLLNGKQVDGEISEFVDAGISLITSSRAEEGLFMELTVRENMFPNVIARGESALSIIHKSQEKTRTFEIDDEFNVKPRTSELAIATLSGGNQQKVILARWLSMQRSVIVLEEPTAGVDVGAKTDIYRLIENATQAGLSILLVSTDFEEVALMAHRALVFSEGKVTKELLRDQLTIQNLVAFASRADQGEN